MRAAALPFTALSGRQAHELFRLRQDVFVVEQECAYPDLDGRDTEPGTRHELLGEVSKTLSVYGAKAHDFTTQQGAKVTVVVTPGSAAVTAGNAEHLLAVHDAAFLGAGTWTVTAEADGFETASQQVKVVAGKAQTVTVTLKAAQTLF